MNFVLKTLFLLIFVLPTIALLAFLIGSLVVPLLTALPHYSLHLPSPTSFSEILFPLCLEYPPMPHIP